MFEVQLNSAFEMLWEDFPRMHEQGRVHISYMKVSPKGGAAAIPWAKPECRRDDDTSRYHIAPPLLKFLQAIQPIKDRVANLLADFAAGGNHGAVASLYECLVRNHEEWRDLDVALFQCPIKRHVQIGAGQFCRHCFRRIRSVFADADQEASDVAGIQIIYRNRMQRPRAIQEYTSALVMGLKPVFGGGIFIDIEV